MNKLKHKILSIILIPIVLFSTTLFSVDKHICMDNVYSISIFGEAANCGMEMENCEENNSNTYTISDEDCCSDENKIISGSEIGLEKEKKFIIKQINLITFFIVSKYFLFNSNLKGSVPFKYYLPFIVTKNISVIYQVFLI